MPWRKDLNKPEKWADSNVMKFSKGKCKILHLGSNKPMHQYVLILDTGNSLVEKDLRLLVDMWLNEPEVYPCSNER